MLGVGRSHALLEQRIEVDGSVSPISSDLGQLTK